MLQQTQVTTVIPYYRRFMDSFPSVEALAASPLDTVLGYWTGLGYYARARNLHRAATIIINQHGGQFPTQVEALSALPGIGRSTAGAIASISMNQAAPILDGNVKRVLCRFHALAGWPGHSAVAKQLWQLAEWYTLADNTRAFSQAMMDLGATLCSRRNPGCSACPLQPHCQAAQQGNMEAYPEAKPKVDKPQRSTWMLALHHNDRILLYRRPDQGIWGGLWSLPEFSSRELLMEHLALKKQSSLKVEELASLHHTFSHFHLHIHPLVARLDQPVLEVMTGPEQIWYNGQEIKHLGLAAPVKKLIQQIL